MCLLPKLWEKPILSYRWRTSVCEVFLKFYPTCHAKKKKVIGTKTSAVCYLCAVWVQMLLACLLLSVCLSPGHPGCGLQLNKCQTVDEPLPFGPSGLLIRQETHCFMMSSKNERYESGSSLPVSMEGGDGTNKPLRLKLSCVMMLAWGGVWVCGHFCTTLLGFELSTSVFT